MGGRSNVLVERFTAVEKWDDLVTQAKTDLVASLYSSGVAEEVVDRWAGVLTDHASDLVDPATVADEAQAIRDFVAEQE